MVSSFLLYPYFCRHKCCEVRYDFRIKRCSIRLYLQLLVGWPMSCLCYLCLLAHSSVQHILGCVFISFCLSLVYPMLPVYLDCPYCVAPLVFSYLYLVALRFLIGIHRLHLGQIYFSHQHVPVVNYVILNFRVIKCC